MIVHGNSDLWLTTYCIFERQCCLNLINQLTSTCASSRVRVWCTSTWKTSPSSEVLNFSFFADLYKFNVYLGKKGNTEFGRGESVVLWLCECLKDTNCYVYFDNFFTSPMLMAKLLENCIYGIGTVRANRKHMLSLKQDNQMKLGGHV